MLKAIMRKTSFVIHFDSLFWPLKKESELIDPSYFKIADRFFRLAEKYGFKYTIFVIGKDLENPAIREKIKCWHEAGHEIANHSYSHDINLGTFKKEKIKEDVLRSHELIYRATGEEPRGFVSPAWSISDNLLEVLKEAGYSYDISAFPSYFMFPMLLKLAALNKKNPEKQPNGESIGKSLLNFLMPKQPYKKNGIVVLPLPVTPILQMPCWHTASFIFGKNLFNGVLRKCLSAYDNFYYVMHPADLADLNDIPAEFRDKLEMFERMNVPLAEKEKHLDLSFQTMLGERKEIVTLGQMSKELI